MVKLFISSPVFGKIDPKVMEPLRALAGLEITTNPHNRLLESDELLALGKDAEILLASTEPLDGLILHSKTLRFISKVGVGYDNLNLKLCKERGVRVHYTPNAASSSVVEQTLAWMVLLLRGLYSADRDLHAGVWQRRFGKELRDSVLGIVGWGRIGQALTNSLLPFGPKEILIADLKDYSLELQTLPTSLAVRQVELKELLSLSNLVSLHVDLNPLSYHLINKTTLSLMQKGSYLINCARGAVVEEQALVDALKSGSLAGAALDVFEKEPYSGSLCALPNVILAPHMGACGQSSRRNMDFTAMEAVMRYLNSQPLLNELL